MDNAASFLVQWYVISNSEDLVQLLEEYGNQCTDWSRVVFHSEREAYLWIMSSKIRECTFIVEGGGYVAFLECWEAYVGDTETEDLPSGVYDTTFRGTCVVSAGCRIAHNELLENVIVYPCACIDRCGRIIGTGSDPSSKERLRRGNGTSVDVGPENGGRSVEIFATMGFVKACQMALKDNGEYEPPRKREECDISDEVLGGGADLVFVLPNTKVRNCPLLEDCYIGAYANVDSSVLRNCTLNSTRERPVTVRYHCFVTDSVLEPGVRVLDGAHVASSYLAETASVSVGGQLDNVILGPDSSIARGECHHSLLGPFIGFHHQSLLIAALWPLGRGNLAYGSMVGSNHTSRVNDQECWIGEGCFFGLGVAVKFPCNFAAAPYSVFAAKTTVSSMKLDYPFSLVLPDPESPQKIVIKPGWVLHANPYLFERAVDKFSSRRKAKDHDTSRPILRRTVVDMVRAARFRLQALLRENKLEISRWARFASAKDVSAGIHAYSDFIQRYALHGAELIAAYVQRYGVTFDSMNLKAPTSQFLAPYAVDSKLVALWMEDVRDLDLPAEEEEDGEDTTGAADAGHFGKPPSISMQTGSETIKGAGLGNSLMVLLSGGRRGVQSRLNALKRHTDSSFLKRGILTDHRLDSVLHQWEVLKEEFPGELFEFDRSTKLYDDLSTSGIDEEAWVDAIGTAWEALYSRLRARLYTLECEYAEEVRRCKEKDAERGRRIIPDYDEVNISVAEQRQSDVGLDRFMKCAARRADDVWAVEGDREE